MSAPMSFQEFATLITYIANRNSPFRSPYPRPSIKYVDPVFDMRTNSVFAITLRGFGSEDKVFHTQNECRDLPESLYERVMNYLDTPVVTLPPPAPNVPRTPMEIAKAGFIC
jgi:hypothetical protein